MSRTVSDVPTRVRVRPAKVSEWDEGAIGNSPVPLVQVSTKGTGVKGRSRTHARRHVGCSRVPCD